MTNPTRPDGPAVDPRHLLVIGAGPGPLRRAHRRARMIVRQSAAISQATRPETSSHSSVVVIVNRNGRGPSVSKQAVAGPGFSCQDKPGRREISGIACGSGSYLNPADFVRGVWPALLAWPSSPPWARSP